VSSAQIVSSAGLESSGARDPWPRFEDADCDCCQAHRLTALPSGFARAATLAIASPWIALLPPVTFAASSAVDPFAPASRPHLARAGPPGGTELARLQVFRR
jgi:hypothetical protein